MKRFKALKIIGMIVAAIILFFLVINLIPPAKVMDENPFVVEEGGLPMVAAHRGGGDCNPENTMLAFREAVKTYKVDIIESDLYLTKDGYLVYNHDSYIDETSNVNGDLTLDQVEDLCETKENRHYIADMAVQYWTINDPDEMRMLIELGCDCIMTDNPELLQQVLEEDL